MRTTNCGGCGAGVNPYQAWQRVTGYEKRRAGGGTNHVALRQPEQAWLCDSCMRREQRGISAQQGSLV